MLTRGVVLLPGTSRHWHAAGFDVGTLSCSTGVLIDELASVIINDQMANWANVSQKRHSACHVRRLLYDGPDNLKV
jgi:hypothetical protein